MAGKKGRSGRRKAHVEAAMKAARGISQEGDQRLPSASQQAATSGNWNEMKASMEANKNAQHAENLEVPNFQSPQSDPLRPNGENSTAQSAPIGDGRTATSSTPPQPKIEIPDAVIKTILDMPFVVAAAQTQYSGFQLTEEESGALIPTAKAVIDQYGGLILGRHGSLIIFSASIAMLAVTKFIAYKSFQREQREKNVRQAA